MKEMTTIQIGRDLHKQLMFFKISTNAKSLNSVLRMLIPKLQEELDQLNQQEDTNGHS